MTPRAWSLRALALLRQEAARSADTHLLRLDLPGFPGIPFYFKDEAAHPTGSLKHRLARSLFLYSLANGWLREGAPVIEASSGSTAVSEAYFARLLGLPFIAVMPSSTSPDKIAAIQFQGGRCHLVEEAGAINAVSRQLARETGGHFMDQFTYAERATDWRANNNIAESIFKQMEAEPHPVPAWIVCSPGTGGTSATLGRYVRYRRHPTRVLCADPEHSVFFDQYRGACGGCDDTTLTCGRGSGIEGIGRPHCEPSFIPACIDAMLKVPDALSLGAMRHVSAVLGRRVGGSTGTNFVGILAAAARMRDEGLAGSIVSILCDSGERYAHSYYNRDWYLERGIPIVESDDAIAAAVAGRGLPPLAQADWPN